MMAATRQEIQGVVDYAKNSILQRLITKSEFQSLAEQVRDRILNEINTLHQENQMMLRQSANARETLMRKTASMEARMAMLEQEVKILQQILSKIFEQNTRTISSLQRY